MKNLTRLIVCNGKKECNSQISKWENSGYHVRTKAILSSKGDDVFIVSIHGKDKRDDKKG